MSRSRKQEQRPKPKRHLPHQQLKAEHILWLKGNELRWVEKREQFSLNRHVKNRPDLLPCPQRQSLSFWCKFPKNDATFAKDSPGKNLYVLEMLQILALLMRGLKGKALIMCDPGWLIRSPSVIFFYCSSFSPLWLRISQWLSNNRLLQCRARLYVLRIWIKNFF